MEKRLNSFIVIFMVMVISSSVIAFKFSDEKGKAVEVFKVKEGLTAWQIADEMVSHIYGGVSFRTEENSKGFLKRYYCSNICIDICDDSTIRFAIDIKAASNVDPVFAWLGKSIGTNEAKSIDFGDYRQVTLSKNEVVASLLVSSKDNRVFAGEIKLKNAN